MAVIKKIETAIVQVPMRRPIIGAVVSLLAIDNVVVRMETDEGLVGWGYVYLPDPSRARVVEAMVADLVPQVLGVEPHRYEHIWQKMWNRANYLGQRGVSMFGMGALDMAVWDLHCRQLGVPLHRLIGGTRESVPCYSSELLEADSSCTDEELAAEAKHLVAAGYPALKMRGGVLPLAQDLDRIGAVRDAIGPDVGLMVDIAQRWTPAQAYQGVKELAQFNLAWLEDPVSQEQIDHLVRLRRRTGIPIAWGHNDYGRYAFRRLLEADAMDVMLVDLARVGGITEFVKVAALAEAHDVVVSGHVYSDICAQLMAALPNTTIMEHQIGWSPPLKEYLATADGFCVPSNNPGIGIEPDLDPTLFGSSTYAGV